MRKYEFTGEVKEVFRGGRSVILHKIRAVAEFGLISVGELGGWIEDEKNLSQDGKSWVCGNAEVCGNARVYGDAEVCGNARVYGNARVCGNASIFSVNHILVIGPVGSRNAFTTFFRDRDNEISVRCGCFLGKIDAFLEKVKETHGNRKHALVYRAAVEVAKQQIDLSLKRPLVVGDKVRIISKEENNPEQNWNPAMEQYLGTVMTVKKIDGSCCRMEEDGGEWWWNDYRIAEVIEE